jgi:hypothetical protein
MAERRHADYPTSAVGELGPIQGHQTEWRAVTRCIFIVLRRSAAIGALLWITSPALGGSAAACRRDYAAWKAAGDAHGQTESAFVRACLASKAIARDSVKEERSAAAVENSLRRTGAETVSK